MEAQYEQNDRREAGQSRPGLLRASGIAGIAGGVCLAASALMQAVQPPGCIAAECVGRTYRSAGPLEALLFLAGVLLITGATLGFLGLVPPGLRGARSARTAAAVAGIAMSMGVVLMGIAYYIGFALVLVGVAAYAVLGAGLALTRVLPAWSGALLSVSALLLMAANDQNERILFVVPFGMTWMVLGVLLWTAAYSTRNQNARVQLA